MLRAAIFVLLYFCAFANCFAQKNIRFLLTDSVPNGIHYEKIVADGNGVQRQADKIVSQLMNQGFLIASVDSIRIANDTAWVTFFVGRRFNWGNISYKYLAEPMRNQFGFDRATVDIVAIDALKNAMSLTLTHFENNGHPFAYFYWDSLVIRNDTISGSLYFEKNIGIAFDTIALYGDKALTKKFLYNYLGLKPGQPYNESIVASLTDKLKKLPYTSMLSKPQVYFVGRKAIVLLNLKKRKTDRLDGLIGFAPNASEANPANVLVTGEFHLDFKNLKGTGKAIKLDWQSFKAQSQTLNAEVNLPYIFNQTIGAQMNIDFLKFDTTYTETRYGLGANYLYSGLDHISVFYEQKNTNLLFADTVNIRLSHKLGSLTAMKTNRYGIAFNKVNLDNPLCPTEGYLTIASVSIFKREIEKDRNINEVKFYNSMAGNYYTVYDSVKLISYQTLLQYKIIKPVKVTKKLILYNELNGYHFISPTIYLNELYRFGGNKSLNGFNEQSLFASSVAIITSEMRYLYSENSYVKVFGNAAYYMDQSKRQSAITKDIPFGFGTGINLETNNGIFNISVALGKSRYNPIDFKNAKVHFGVINYF